MNKIAVIAAPFDPAKMHIYSVKTKGKHPVHLIDAGDYLTEDEMPEDYAFCGYDMGWFWLNEKEYQYFKSRCRLVNVEYNG